MMRKRRTGGSLQGVSLLGVPLQGVSLHFTLYNLSCIGRENISFVAVRNGLNHMLSFMINFMINLQGERE